jgi:hypothetical protein
MISPATRFGLDGDPNLRRLRRRAAMGRDIGQDFLNHENHVVNGARFDAGRLQEIRRPPGKVCNRSGIGDDFGGELGHVASP